VRSTGQPPQIVGGIAAILRGSRFRRERHLQKTPALLLCVENVEAACLVPDTAGWSSEHMPLRQEAQFLRERARRLREIAGAYQTALSQQLREMAAELETRADELEKANPPNE